MIPPTMKIDEKGFNKAIEECGANSNHTNVFRAFLESYLKNSDHINSTTEVLFALGNFMENIKTIEENREAFEALAEAFNEIETKYEFLNRMKNDSV